MAELKDFIGKVIQMNRLVFFLVVPVLVAGCVTPSGSLVNSSGQRVDCRAAGFGIISGTMAKNRYEECVSRAQMNGYVMSDRAGLTGIEFLEEGEPIVARLTPGGSAGFEGIEVGDVVEEVGGKAVTTAAEARQLLFGEPRTLIEVVVRRGDKRYTVTLRRI